MSVAQVALGRDDVRHRYRQLVTALRDVEHWRRLVAARLDLAVAAVTGIDDLAPVDGPGALPDGLRELIGLPAGLDAGTEVTTLLRLRAVLDALDAQAARLRPMVAAAAADVGARSVGRS